MILEFGEKAYVAPLRRRILYSLCQFYVKEKHKIPLFVSILILLLEHKPNPHNNSIKLDVTCFFCELIGL